MFDTQTQIGDRIATILSSETDKSKIMVDVGMNSGYFGVMSASLGFNVMALDPQPACHALMKKTKAANGWDDNVIQTYLMGLGDGGKGIDNDIEMHIGSCHGGYSWPDQWGAKEDAVKVPVHSLAEVIGDLHVSVMKMDTEGNEMSILSSGLDIFKQKQVDYLIVETKPFVWDNRGIDKAPIYLLEDLAVSVTKINGGAKKEKGTPFASDDYLFSFNSEPTSQTKSVSFKKC